MVEPAPESGFDEIKAVDIAKVSLDLIGQGH